MSEANSIPSPRILVIIPAFNEEKNIPSVISELHRDFSEAEILVINDCSSDKTAEAAFAHGAKCISHPFNMGYAHGLLSGFKYAKRNGFDILVQFDGDGQHVAKEAKRLVEDLIASGADIVIGSRFLKDTGFPHPFFRRVGTRLFRAIIRAVCKRTITDPTSGFQALSRSAFSRFAEMPEYPEYPDANLLIDLLLDGYHIEERSVLMRERLEGVSMHNGVWKPARYMFLMLYSILLILIKPRGWRHKSRRSTVPISAAKEDR